MASKGGVHISYLVVAIVICLGLVGVVFVQNTKVQDEVAAKDRAKAKLETAENNHRTTLEELTVARALLIGPGVDDAKPDYEALSALLGKAGEEMAKADAGRPATEMDSFQNYLVQSFPVIQNWRERFEQQVAAADAEAARNEATQEAKTSLEELSGKTEEDLRQKNNDTTIALEKASADAEAMETRLREQMEDKEEQLTAEIQKFIRDLRVSENLRKRAENRLEHLLAERRDLVTFDKVVPDGEIVQVSEELGFAWIDLGRNHRLESGTVFDVFQFVKGGRRAPKGKVEVVKIDADMAQVSITHLLDDLNPMLPGDKVASPFYSPEDKPIFVMAGTEMSTRRLDVKELKLRVDRFGGVLADKVTIETDYVVCLKEYEDTDEYKDARQLGITVLSEDQILGFLGQ